MTIEEDLKLGKTGQFPQGKLNADDEGELTIAVGIENGAIVIRFGTPVVWIGLDATAALNLANSILEKYRKLRTL